MDQHYSAQPNAHLILTPPQLETARATYGAPAHGQLAENTVDDLSNTGMLPAESCAILKPVTTQYGGITIKQEHNTEFNDKIGGSFGEDSNVQVE